MVNTELYYVDKKSISITTNNLTSKAIDYRNISKRGIGLIHRLDFP